MNTPQERIRAARRARRLTQAEAADLIGLSLRPYTSIENGTARLTLERLDELAKALGTSAAWLAYGVDGFMVRAEHKLDLMTLEGDLREVMDALTSGGGAGQKLTDMAIDLRDMIDRINLHGDEAPKPVAA